MSFLKCVLSGAAVAALALSFSSVALAQAYPSKPVKIVVPYPPGGTNDIVARLLAQKLQEQMGQTFIVENKAGASGNTGADAVAKSDADGYTLILVTTGHSIAPSLHGKLPYDITKDLAPVSTLVSGPMLVLTNPASPLKSMADLIAAAKAKPGEINYGSAGNGSTTHLSAELIATTTGVKFNHIPYKGSAPAMTDVMGGTTDMVMDLMFSSMPHVTAGKLRAIAITSAARAPALPDVPTLAESGLPGLVLSVWNGLMVPANTPKDVVAKLNTAIRKAMSAPDIKERLASQGFTVHTGTPEQFSAELKAEIERWTKAVKASGAKAS
ncbi:Bug family tripartite tricarboxylate transporter substrate binding protein [Piscinibacter sp.]|uniref:Bug family tripartite tricarboxylate transporter substrate binding protein n=1 Tax=Piscinibacter sp. TaxID=1903157 RepID=UPI002CC8C74F|nr:tripartite tricarboxylate transporter substrate binding protein [Albitalea sp.]HUG21093.1 tripartite tricarboxylate transporter substrate binding protein [Albitalea sp.]